MSYRILDSGWAVQTTPPRQCWRSLAAVLVLGPRLGKYGPMGEINPIPGANMPLAALISNDEATIVGQLTGLAGIFVWTFVASLVIWLSLKAVMGIRISEEQEFAGADISECGIEAYPEFKNA